MEGHHLPAFDRLCDWARENGLTPSLRAGALRAGEQGRELVRLDLWAEVDPTVVELVKPAAAAPIYEDDIEGAALELLSRVA